MSSHRRVKDRLPSIRAEARHAVRRGRHRRPRPGADTVYLFLIILFGVLGLLMIILSRPFRRN